MYSRLQYLRNTGTVDYHNQLLHSCVIHKPGLIHTAPVITLQQFCDPFPFVQFVSYEKGFKPCEKLPLYLIFLCCLTRENWVTGKNMNEAEREGWLGCQEVPVTWRARMQKVRVVIYWGRGAFKSAIQEHEGVRLRRCQSDTTVSDADVLRTWMKPVAGKAPGCLFGPTCSEGPNNLPLYLIYFKINVWTI